MKKLFVIALGFLLDPLATLAQPAVLIAEYRFDTLMIPAPALTGLYGTNYRSYMNPLVLSSAGNFYTAGLTTVNGGYFTTGKPPAAVTNRGAIGAGWPQTLSLTKYMGFSLTPIAGQTLVIDSISQWSAKSNQGPDTTRMRTSVGGYPPNSWYTVNAGDVSWRRSSRTTGLPSSSSTIQIRYYTYHNLLNPNPSGTWRIDDIKVYGHLENIYNLPVELTHFNALPYNSVVKLDWSTATEKNNSHFTVYRSKDLKTWEEVTRVTGAGNSQSSISYETVDDKPFAGISYYNLQQTDFDNKSRDVGTVSVQMKESNSFTFLLYQEFSWEGQTTAIFDTSGRMISGWNTVHTLTSPGIFLLVTRQGETAKIHITP